MSDPLAETRALPERPMLKPWYRLAVERERIVLEYGASVLELHGRAAAQLLPHLLPLLDGTNRVDDIVARLGEPVRRAVEGALRLLHEHRLLTEAPPDGVAGSRLRAAQLLAATDPLDRTIGEVAARLEQSTVAIVGSAPVAGTVSALLAQSGVRVLGTAGWDEAERADLHVAGPADGELRLLRAWNRRALETRSTWLQLLPFDGLIAAVGPLFVPGETACHECYLVRRSASLSTLPHRPEPPERGIFPTAPALDAVAAGLAASLALRWLGLADGFVPGVLHAVEQAAETAVSRHVVYRVPRCRACSPARAHAALLPWHTEQSRAA